MPKKTKIPTFVKWAGGKTQLISQFEEFFPNNFNKYLEPFVGSGAVFFHVIMNYNPDRSIISDSNEDLINTYIVVRDNLESLLDLLKEHKRKHSKEYYYKIRETDVSKLNNVEKAARLLYLNKTCFNGLYRVNSKGKFNVPFGKYKNPNIVNEENLRKASELLQGADIRQQSFENVQKDAEEGDFVYLDPPYYPISDTSYFTSYTKDVFLDEEQKNLAEVFQNLNKKGCLVMLSNSDSRFIKSLYENNGCYIYTVRARRAINSNAEKRGAINELVVVNYPVNLSSNSSLENYT